MHNKAIDKIISPTTTYESDEIRTLWCLRKHYISPIRRKFSAHVRKVILTFIFAVAYDTILSTHGWKFSFSTCEESAFNKWVENQRQIIKEISINLEGILKQEFGKFGRIRKIFVDEEKTFAKVYFDDEEELRKACQALDGYLSWSISLRTDEFKPKSSFNFESCTETYERSTEMNASEYADFDVKEYNDYVDIHGNPITVLEGDDGEFFVSLADVKKAGFAIFKRDNYDPIIVDKRQVLKEFEMHLLAEGKKYLLKAKAIFRQEEILKTIEEVERKLLGNDVKPQQTSFNAGRVVDPSGRITFPTESAQSKSNLVPADTLNRPPRQLQENMGASHTNHNISNKFSRNTNTRDVNKENRPYNTRNESNYGRNESSAGQKYMNGYQREPRETKLWEQQGARPKLNEMKPPRPVVKSEREETWGNEIPWGSENKAETKVETSSVGSSKNNVFQGSSFEKVQLPIGSKETLIITHVQRKNEKKIYYAQLAKNEEDMSQILIEAAEKYPVQEVVEAAVGLPCLIEFEGIWYRGEVFDKNIPLIYLLDYGNREKNISGPLKVMPESLAKIPAQAARLTISVKEGEEATTHFDIDDHVTVIAKRQYDDGTYLVDIVEGTQSETSKQQASVGPVVTAVKPEATKPIKTETSKLQAAVEPVVTAVKPVTTKPLKIEPAEPEVIEEKEVAYFDVPEPVDTLKDGEKVMLIDQRTNRLLVRTKMCVKQCKDIITYIASLDKKPITNLVKGQLVLCSKDGLNGLHRAIVTDISGPVATVDYVDYVGEGSLSVKSLRNVDEKLAKEPRTVLISPEFKPLENMKEPSLNFLTQLIEQKAKLDVVLPSEKQFDLKLEGGNLLSAKIQELDNPKPQTPTPSKVEERKQPDQPKPVKEEQQPMYEPVSYDSMQFMEPTPGIANYMCYTFVDTTEVTLLSTVDTAMEYLKRLMQIEGKDDQPYEPEVMEMCLASFKGPEEEEALWYRGVVIDKESGNFSISFVDYGNSEKLTAKDLRRYPADLKDIPILGMTAYLKGVPNTPAVVDKLKEFITDGSFHDINIENTTIDENLKYAVEIPSLYEELKKAGLLK